MTGRTDAGEAGRAIADALRAANLPHALGGALALGVAGVPRGTKDVDVNVFVGLDEVPRVISTLASLGIVLDAPAALRRAERDGMFVGTWDGMRIDVFVPSIPFSFEANRTAIEIEVDGWRGRFLSAEAIAVFKLLFFRGKDLVDLERLIGVRGDRLDVTYVRRWIVEMMGEDDARVARWDDLVARFGGSSAPS
jgi:hypothetical protein